MQSEGALKENLNRQADRNLLPLLNTNQCQISSVSFGHSDMQYFDVRFLAKSWPQELGHWTNGDCWSIY